MRAGRERLLRELVERGHSVQALREAHRLDRIPVLLLEDAMRERAYLSARDVAAACDVDVETVLRINRLLGMGRPDPDAPAFDESSFGALGTYRIARDSGLPEETIDELLVVLGRHMWQLAADMEVLVGSALGRAGDTEYELAHRYADAARVLAPAAAPLIVSAFTAHLRERMRDIFVTPEEVVDGGLRALTDVAVAFVDVVGFTGLGARVDAGQLKSVAAS